MKLGEYIKQKRLNKHLSQRKLAEMTGVDSSTICRIEKGEVNNFSIGVLLALSKVIDLDMEYILNNTTQETVNGEKRIKYERDNIEDLLSEIEEILREHEGLIERQGLKGEMLELLKMFLYLKNEKEKRNNK